MSHTRNLINTEIPDIETTVFRPTREQQQSKANFWSFFQSGDISVVVATDLRTALKHGRDSRIRQWWDLPGFQQWFHNRDEFRQRAEFLSNSALIHLEQILLDEKSQASAKVAAIKLIMELSGKLTKTTDPEKFADSKINQMNRTELEEFIRARSKSLLDDQTEKPN